MTGRAAIYASLAFVAAFLAYSLYGEPAKAPAAPVPEGFSQARVVDVPAPTAMDFLPDGRMIAISKPGQAYIVDGGAKRRILDLGPQTCFNGERGLLGVAVDPRFGTEGNNFVYLYYTYKKFDVCDVRLDNPNKPVNRVSRFEMRDGELVKGSEEILLNNMFSTKGNHNAGDLHFGNDGKLYASVGDGGCDYAELNHCQYENDSSRDPHILNGKILRINPDGSIPADNPFTGPNSEPCASTGRTEDGKNCQETYLKGFRNPFRFAVDPDAAGTVLHVNDVGGQRWEEIDRARVGTADDGKDYGWNICEGRHDNPDRVGSTACDGDVLTGPVHEYSHGKTGCESITGGAFVPDGFWPESYDDAYLFGDYVCGKIFTLKPADGGGYQRTPLVTGMGQSSATAMAFGPYLGDSQALYYASFENGGVIRRLTYGTPTANVAMTEGTNNYGPLTMSFDASESKNPEGGTLRYIWDFGDGTTETTDTPTNSHTYAQRGRYTVKLRVENAASGAADTATIDVFPGNQPPEPTVQGPADESRFVVDEQLRATGSATDPDGDGVQSLEWQVLQHHDQNHTHPWASGSGDTLTFDAPAPEGLYSTEPNANYLEVRLTATDALGLSKTTTVDLRPDTVDLTFRTEPVPLDVKVNGRTFRAPRTLLSWVGYDLNVSATYQRSGNRAYVFDRWSDGGARSHTIDSPEDPTTYTATFRRAGN